MNDINDINSIGFDYNPEDVKKSDTRMLDFSNMPLKVEYSWDESDDPVELSKALLKFVLNLSGEADRYFFVYRLVNQFCNGDMEKLSEAMKVWEGRIK